MKRIARNVSVILLVITLAFFAYQFFSWKALPIENMNSIKNELNADHSESQIEATQLLMELVHTLHVPSASAAVAVNGEIVWEAAYGYADIEQKIQANTNTLYRIGSTSKAVTSIALMKLVQEGKLDLDQAVSSIITDFPEKKWDFTTRQLLSHTAGIPDYEDLGLYGLYFSLLNISNFSSVDEGLKLFKNVPLLFEPGTDFKYNSFGPVLASRVLEIQSGMGFEDYMKRHIFIPSKMSNTYFDKGDQNPVTIAKFYETDNGGKYRNWHTFGFPKQTQNLSYKWAGGGLLSTPKDLVQLGNRLLNDVDFINPQIREQFFTPQQLRNGEVNPQNYALGWRVNTNYSSKYFKNNQTTLLVHHGGVSKGSMNFLCLFPEKNIVINVSTNGRSDTIDFMPFWNYTMKIVSVFM